MDGYNNNKKKSEAVSSTSSFTAELFGFKEPSPSSSSAGVFASIFQPPSAVLGRNSPIPEVRGSWQKHHSPNPGWNTKQATLGEGASYNMPNNNRNSIYSEERVEPCHLSSSIYYGGQDNCSQSPATQAAGSYPMFKKDGGEDDPNENSSHGVSRGNWWQGSLYY